MRKRGHISMREEYAALIGAFLGIPYDHRKEMTFYHLRSLLHFDHDPIPHAHGGPDKHFNLTPLPIMAHRKKTAEVDVPQLAKTKRIEKNEAIHQAAMASKAGRYQEAAQILATAPKPPIPKRKIPSRPFPKGHRPLRSRSSFERQA